MSSRKFLPVSGYWMPDTGYRIQDVGYWMLGAGAERMAGHSAGHFWQYSTYWVD
jgi:hypothetical protein